MRTRIYITSSRKPYTELFGDFLFDVYNYATTGIRSMLHSNKPEDESGHSDKAHNYHDGKTDFTLSDHIQT